MVSLGLLAALGASGDQAAVIYELTGPGPSFVYTSADFVTSEGTVNAGDLTSDDFNPGQVASVTFSPGVFADIL